MGTVTTRPATMADVPMLEAWDTQPHVAYATGTSEARDWPLELAMDPAVSRVLIGEEDGRPVGVVCIIDPREEESHYWGDVEPDLRALDIWLGDTADLGRGLGTALMALALAECFADEAVSAVLIDPLASNTRAIAFYERLGFERLGPRTFGEDACIVCRITRARWSNGGQ